MEIIGLVGFFLCLFLMYLPGHGIQEIRSHAPGFRILDMRLHYTADDVYAAFAQLGEAGRLAYRRYLLLDYVFICCFFLVMAAISRWAASSPRMYCLLIGAAALRATLDFCENSLLLFLLRNSELPRRGLATACSWVTTLKFLALFVWVLGILWCFIARIRG